MKTKIISILILLLSTSKIAHTQNAATQIPPLKVEHLTISLDSTLSVSRSCEENIVIPIKVNADLRSYDQLENYSFNISMDETDMPKQSYKLDANKISFKAFSENKNSTHTCYLTLFKDSIPDRMRKMNLKVEVFNLNEKLADSLNDGKYKVLKINIQEHRLLDPLDDYNYLVYLGTNFDLVEGQQTKNLFFASNVFLPPLKKQAIGLYLSFYGNRTMTSTDTTQNVLRTTRIAAISDTSHVRFTEQSTLVTKSVSDNLGAYVSPIFRLDRLSNINNIIQMYYAPSLEFIWRRSSIGREYMNPSNIDSNIQAGKAINQLIYPNNYSYKLNEFSFNAGLIGLMVTHQNKNISIRIHGSVGYQAIYFPLSSSNDKNATLGNYYDRKKDIFFSGRAWITEANTGITLQAEISNTLNAPRPYYGVTLSKAINFTQIGKLFQPIISR